MVARTFLFAAILLSVPAPASAELWTWNPRLDHALWPEHKEKLVVAGDIVAVASKREFRFRVSDVILGAGSYRGQTLTLHTSILWPETLTPLTKGASCLLVLGTRRGEHYVSAIVPGRRREYSRAADSVAARAILEEELLAQLKDEKSKQRQRALLLQLAPILLKDNAEAMEPFLASSDEWVRRAALAGALYATEDAKYAEAAANDVKDYFQRMNGIETVKVVDERKLELRKSPQALLLEYYFFLARRSWTWGSMWNEREAEKHLRILKGMLDHNILDESVEKRLREG